MPAIDDRLGSAFEEGHPPFLTAWAFAPGRAAGARASYGPIAYTRGATVTLSTRIEAFEVEFLRDEGLDASNFPHLPKTATHALPEIQVDPGEVKVLGAVPEGEGTLETLALLAPAWTEEMLQNVWLRIFVDGEPSPGIEARLESLFGRSAAADAFDGVAFVNTEKELRMRLPVPFASGVRIELDNRGKAAVSISAEAVLNRDPLLFSTRRLRVREWGGTVKPGVPCEILRSSRGGHFVGFTARFERGVKPILGTHLHIEADGDLAYRSVNLASVFDGGDEFARAPYTTVGAGLSHVSESHVMGHCWRLSRIVPYEKSLRVWFDSRVEGPVEVRGAVLTYEDPLPAAEGAASAPASKPSGSSIEETPASKP